MKKFVIIFYLSILFVCSGFSAAEEGTDAGALPVSRMLLRLEPNSRNEERPGCWPRTLACLGATARVARDVAQQAMTVMEFAMPFIHDEAIKKIMQQAMDGIRVYGKTIKFNEDGSLVLPTGETIANAVFLVMSDKTQILTNESKTLCAVVMALLPEKDYEVKIKLVAHLAAVDDPSTPFSFGFNRESGDLQLLNGSSPLPLKTLSLFNPEMDETRKNLMRVYFTEYMQASAQRTRVEVDHQERSSTFFLQESSQIVRDYRELIASNPLFTFVQ